MGYSLLLEVVLASSLMASRHQFCQQYVDGFAILVCMPDLEQELRHAIAYRNEMAVELATWLLRLANDGGWYDWPITIMTHSFSGQPDHLLANVEALTAVILNRAGMPWDAMAAQVECSKQALHRRHARRGEAQFDEANSRLGRRDRTTVVRDLLDALEALEAADHAPDGADEIERGIAVRRSLPWASADMIENLVGLPRPASILSAGNSLAAALVKFRKISRWWWYDREDLDSQQERRDG
jgi:hypothetical protein